MTAIISLLLFIMLMCLFVLAQIGMVFYGYCIYELLVNGEMLFGICNSIAFVFFECAILAFTLFNTACLFGGFN